MVHMRLSCFSADIESGNGGGVGMMRVHEYNETLLQQ